MANYKFALVCALVALAVVSASTLDLDLNVSDQELSLVTESSMLELDSALAAVKAMDQDMAMETGARWWRRRRRSRRHHGGGGARPAHRPAHRPSHRAHHRPRHFNRPRHVHRPRRVHHHRRRAFRHRARRHRNRRGGRRVARRHAVRRARRAARKAARQAKYAHKMMHIARKTGNKALIARAKHAMNKARALKQKAQRKNVQAVKAKAKARKALRKKAKRNAKKLKKQAKKARKQSKKQAKKLKRKAKATKAMKRKLRRAQNRQLANQVVGDTTLSPAVSPLYLEVEKALNKLSRLLSNKAGEKPLESFKLMTDRIVKLYAHIRNAELRAQKKEIRAQRRQQRATREKKAMKKHKKSAANPAQRAAVKAEAKKAKKDQRKAIRLEAKAKREKRHADAKAAKEHVEINKLTSKRTKVAATLVPSLSAEGVAELESIKKKISQLETITKAEIKAAKTVPIVGPKLTRKELIKADPKGKFKKLDHNGVTAAEARLRIIKMHDENKFHDFSTMAMDRLLGVHAEIPPKKFD